ncbi:MAG: ThiF family adenylyltransferase [Thermoplasmata archaeon]|jgi:molybdopterin/thiamine biosynthesis adenylyltransferase
MEEQLRVGSIDDDVFDRSKRIGWLDLESIARSKVMMVGAGALGNEVAKNLALSGFRNITVIDMDHVVGSNLNRCLFFSREDAQRRASKADAVARGILSISPDARPVPMRQRIEDLPEGAFKDYDLVLGCLDNIQARIHTNSHSYHAGKVYIDGGMEGFLGKVMVARPPVGACVQCGMNRSHSKVAELRFSCTGKDVVFHEPRLAAEITTTSVISAIMVREALKVVSSRPDMLIANAFYYDGQRNQSEELEIPLNPNCPVHLKP